MSRLPSAVSIIKCPSEEPVRIRPTSSPVLVAIQRRADSPFGMLFLGVPPVQPKAIYKGRFVCKASTKEPEETGDDTKDGSSSTDWATDEDNWKD